MTAIAKAMREYGVIRYLGNGVELVLGPPPLTVKEKEEIEKKKVDPRARKREHFSTLLGRFVGDQELDMLPDS